MDLWWWILLAMALYWIASRGLKRSRIKRLPAIDKNDFLSHFPPRLVASSSSKILDGRRFVAHELGIPENKLSPNMRFEELKGHLDLSVDLYMAHSHLLEDLEEMLVRSGVEFDPNTLDEDSGSVGSYIQLFVRSSSESAQAAELP